eukprot:m.135571 g.135571  ORF g.135571 m.135571 type:complete len:107 (-) comp14872_c3_seq4:185-505(-)
MHQRALTLETLFLNTPRVCVCVCGTRLDGTASHHHTHFRGTSLHCSAIHIVGLDTQMMTQPSTNVYGTQTPVPLLPQLFSSLLFPFAPMCPALPMCRKDRFLSILF